MWRRRPLRRCSEAWSASRARRRLRPVSSVRPICAPRSTRQGREGLRRRECAPRCTPLLEARTRRAGTTLPTRRLRRTTRARRCARGGKSPLAWEAGPSLLLLLSQHALTFLSPSIPGEGRGVVGAQGREGNGTPRERLRARGPNARTKRRADERDAREECRVSPIVRFQGMNPGRSSSGCMRPTSLTNIMFRPFRSFLTAPDRWRQTH